MIAMLIGFIAGAFVSVTAMLLYNHKTRPPKYMISNNVDPFSNC